MYCPYYFVFRKMVRFVDPTSPVLAANDTSNDHSDTNQRPVWISDLCLYESDLHEIRTPTTWLNDRVINASQQLLKADFPQTNGLLDTVTLGCSGIKLDIASSCVQIVYDAAREHWFTITSVGCDANTVDVYDCVNGTPSNDCVKVITKAFCVDGSQLNIRVLNMVKQLGKDDCSLFAIAYATTIVNGGDPVNVVYDQGKMREHLERCLTSGHMSVFPVLCHRTVRRRFVRKIPVLLYCICKTSYVSGDGMVCCDSCRVWYHPSCIGLSEDEFVDFREQRSKRYKCTSCQ